MKGPDLLTALERFLERSPAAFIQGTDYETFSTGSIRELILRCREAERNADEADRWAETFRRGQKQREGLSLLVEAYTTEYNTKMDRLVRLERVREAAAEFLESVYQGRFTASSLDSPFFEKANRLNAALRESAQG